MNSILKDKSIVYWYPDSKKHKCGYCKNERGSISSGMWAETLTVEDYQNLIDRGWRRSGKYCYKPIMQETCCPQYTIKCDALHFSLSKSQKKVIKKFNRYLEEGIASINDFPAEAQFVNEDEPSATCLRARPNFDFSKIGNSSKQTSQDREVVKSRSLATGEPLCDKPVMETKTICDIAPSKVKSFTQNKLHQKNTFKEGIGADSSKPPCKKKKLLRIERQNEKRLKNGLDLQKKEPVQMHKSLEQFLEDVSQNSKLKLRLELVPTSEPGIEWDQVKEIEYELYRKYQMIVHNDPSSKLSMSRFHRSLVNSPLKISTVRMSQSHELFDVSFNLYKKYQMMVHSDSPEDVDKEQFFGFLVQTPLKAVKFPNGIDGPGYGSFHQQYWVHNKLIAVGVIDILPRCVSSVYFFYDPDYSNLTLGMYSSLREIQFTRSLQRKVPQLSNYYIGFYIHTCQKMKYKGKLVPSSLACPETYHWIPIERCLPKLDVRKYSRLDNNIDAVDEDRPSTKEINEIQVVYNREMMYFKQYKRLRSEDQELFNEIGSLIGKKCTKSIVFYIN